MEVRILDLTHSPGMRFARHYQPGRPYSRATEPLYERTVEAAVDLVLEEVGDKEFLLVFELAQELRVRRFRPGQVEERAEEDGQGECEFKQVEQPGRVQHLERRTA